MPTPKKKKKKETRAVPIYVRPKISHVLAAGGTHCEGLYNCTGSGGLYTVGDRSIVGFWGVHTCPGSATLGDNSTWTLVPLTCKCE